MFTPYPESVRKEFSEYKKEEGCIYNYEYFMAEKETVSNLLERAKANTSVTITSKEVTALCELVLQAFDHTHFGSRVTRR